MAKKLHPKRNVIYLFFIFLLLYLSFNRKDVPLLSKANPAPLLGISLYWLSPLVLFYWSLPVSIWTSQRLYFLKNKQGKPTSLHPVHLTKYSLLLIPLFCQISSRSLWWLFHLSLTFQSSAFQLQSIIHDCHVINPWSLVSFSVASDNVYHSFLATILNCCWNITPSDFSPIALVLPVSLQQP